MKKLLLSATAIALALPSAAHAGEAYIGFSGGIVLPEDSQNEGSFDSTVPATESFDAIPAGTPLEWTTEFNDTWAASGQIGYAFDNGFRVEVEGFYNKYDVDRHSGLLVGGADIGTVDVAVLTRGTPSAANPSVADVLADGQGDVANYGGFLNVLYDLEVGAAKPYFGGGIGYQWTEVDYRPSNVVVGNGKDDGWAWQALVGVSAPISSGVDLFAQYAYRSSFNDVDLPLTLLPATIGIENSQSIVTAGLRMKFGGQEPAPMPVAPPPPPPRVAPTPPPMPVAPPPPPQVMCQTGPYIVFFDFDKSDVTPEAATVLNSAITAYGDCGTAAIMLAGHTDRSGSVTYNQALANRRNASVQSYLTGRGVPAMRISSEAFGEAVPRVATADGVREAQNRRVEISYGPGSGM